MLISGTKAEWPGVEYREIYGLICNREREFEAGAERHFISDEKIRENPLTHAIISIYIYSYIAIININYFIFGYSLFQFILVACFVTRKNLFLTPPPFSLSLTI